MVSLFTDGACSGNPGPGGWAAILRHEAHEKVLSGGERDTTNNRMELTAVIRGLEALRRPCAVTLYSDSRYVTDALLKGWARAWRAKSWRRGDGSPALNSDLWERLLALCERHRVTPVWIRGHADHPENSRCDALAVAESKKFTRE